MTGDGIWWLSSSFEDLRSGVFQYSQVQFHPEWLDLRWSHLWKKKTDLFKETIYIRSEYLMPHKCKLFLFRIVAWSDNCLLRIIISNLLRAILKKSWQQHPTRHQLYGHLPPITKTIQVRRTRHAGHCWRSRDELIRDVLLWIPTHGRAKAGRPARTYIQQLCEDTGCCPEDLPRAMNNREEWRERVRDIRATSAIWWWWTWNYICMYANKEYY